jgi:hypothetical protein
LQEELNEVIITVLRRRKALSYFQVRVTVSYVEVVADTSIGISRHHLGTIPHFLAIRTPSTLPFRISLVVSLPVTRKNKRLIPLKRSHRLEITNDGVPF